MKLKFVSFLASGLMWAFLANPLCAAESSTTDTVRAKSELSEKAKAEQIAKGKLERKNRLYRFVREQLAQCQLTFVEDSTNLAFEVRLMQEGIFHHLNVTICIKDDELVCYHELPFLVAEGERQEFASLLSILNTRMNHGSYEMDCLNTGLVRFRTYVTEETFRLSERYNQRFGELLCVGALMIQSHEKLLAAVFTGLMTAKEAFEKYGKEVFGEE